MFFRYDDVLELTKRYIQQIGPERWRNACDHVEKRISVCKKSDHVVDDVMDTFVIDLRDSSDDDSDD